jgi:hypothetical protein
LILSPNETVEKVFTVPECKLSEATQPFGAWRSSIVGFVRGHLFYD